VLYAERRHAVCCHVICRYAECRSAERRYAGCHRARDSSKEINILNSEAIPFRPIKMAADYKRSRAFGILISMQICDDCRKTFCRNNNKLECFPHLQSLDGQGWEPTRMRGATFGATERLDSGVFVSRVGLRMKKFYSLVPFDRLLRGEINQ